MSSFKRVDFYFHLKAFSMAPFERLTLLGMGWGTFLLRTKEESRACKWQTFPGFGELNERKCFFFWRGFRTGSKRPAQPISDTVFCSFTGGKRDVTVSPASHPLSPLPTRNTYVWMHSPMPQAGLMSVTFKINSCRSFTAVGHLLLLPRFSLPVIIIIICHFQYGA